MLMTKKLIAHMLGVTQTLAPKAHSNCRTPD
jgi:hypothetical protein